MFNLLTIITLAWIILFTCPRMYRDNKETIDNLVEKIKSTLTKNGVAPVGKVDKNLLPIPEKEE